MKAALFDIDGTLVDSVEFHALAWQEAFASYGHEIELHRLRDQIGKGGDQLMPQFLSEQEMHRVGAALDERRATIFRTKYLPKISGFPETRQLFERLATDGWTIGLASSAKNEELETYKRIAGIEDLVAVETASDDAAKSKPYPDIFQAALHRLKDISPDRVIAVGDTPYDAIAAGRSGIRTIGLRCGGWSVRDLKAAGCIAVYGDPADLLAHFDTCPFSSRPSMSKAVT